MNRAVLIAFLCLALITSCTNLPVKQSGNQLINKAQMDKSLRALVDNNTLVGTTALVYHNNTEVYFGAFGMANKESGTPIQRDSIFQMFSMTKPITGAVLMTFFDEGKFKLEDPLVKYIPEFTALKVISGIDQNKRPIYEELHRNITILDLMRHTAGWSQWGDDKEQPIMKDLWEKQNPLDRNNSADQVAERLSKVPLLFQPGTRWYYGPSVDVQALLVEKLSGKPYIEVLQDRVLKPLHMIDTGYRLPQKKRHRLTALYQREENGSMTPDLDSTYDVFAMDWSFNPGGEGLVSTLDDYMRFARMLQNGGQLDGVRILKPETVALMSTDFMPSDVSDKSWLPSKGQVGFGLNFAVRISPPKDKTESAGIVGEFFWDGWSNTLFFVDRKYKITAVLFNHYYPFGNTTIQKSFRDAVYSLIPEAHY